MSAANMLQIAGVAMGRALSGIRQLPWRKISLYINTWFCAVLLVPALVAGIVFFFLWTVELCLVIGLWLDYIDGSGFNRHDTHVHIEICQTKNNQREEWHENSGRQ